MFKRIAVHFFHFHVKSLVCDICSFKFSHRVLLNGATIKHAKSLREEGLIHEYTMGNETGCFKRKSVLFFFLFFVVKCFYFKRLKLTKRWSHLSPHAVTKRGHGHTGLLSPFSSFDQLLLEKMKRQSGLHIWREVPFTRHKETGRRKTKQRTQDTNDTTFQSN